MLVPANSPSFPIQGVYCITSFLKYQLKKEWGKAVTMKGEKTSLPCS